MPQKPKLSEQLGQRKQSGQLPAEPVASRDALKEVEQALGVVSATPSVPQPAPKRARTPARTQEAATSIGGISIEDLYRRVMQKRHLASSTFRYRAEELEDLDTVVKTLAEKAPENNQLSKNDIARAALIWLLEDYHARGEQSVLEQLAERL